MKTAPAWISRGFLCALWVGVAQADEPPPVQVAARASKAEVTVGEAFTVEVEASGPAGTTFLFPPEAKSENAELATPPPPSPAPGEAVTLLSAGRHVYEARVFGLGEVTLPAVVVRYRLSDGKEGEATAPAVAMKVGSLLPKDQQEHGLADIRGPVGVGIAPVFWVALGLGLLMASGLAYLVGKRLGRKPPGLPVEPVADQPPADEARLAMEALARGDHFARGDGRGYYIALAAIAKRYLERRLGAPILGMTTSEMLRHLRESPHGSALVAPMRDLALAADQVKFAKGEALRAEGDRHLAAARALVDRLEALLAPKPEEGKAA